MLPARLSTERQGNRFGAGETNQSGLFCGQDSICRSTQNNNLWKSLQLVGDEQEQEDGVNRPAQLINFALNFKSLLSRLRGRLTPTPTSSSTSTSNIFPTTESSSFPRGHLSPRALEKQPVRNLNADVQLNAADVQYSPPPVASRALVSDPSALLTLPSADNRIRPPVTGTSHIPSNLTPTHHSSPQRPPVVQRRSFLDALLTRQNKVLPRDDRTATSRVLNPINYVPRPTPVRVQPTTGQSRHQRKVSPDAITGEVHTLLTIPEQRRSRQHSPTDPAVEHSPGLTPQEGRDPSSIGLPANQYRGSVIVPEAQDREPRIVAEASSAVKQMVMVEPEKQDPESNGLKEPDRAHIHTAKHRQSEWQQQSPTVLGQSYGISPLDQPLQPPRRITSRLSLRRAQSTASIHSTAYGRTNSETVPVPGSQEDVGQQYTDGGSVGEELAWGPSHPCFPHLNPHVPVNSPEYAATRIIRIRRDWMVVGDLAPTFSNIYPEILDPLMPEQEFRYVVEHINHTLIHAYDPFSAWNWFDGLMGLLTGWFWEDFRPMGIKGQLRALEQWLEDWNHTVGAKAGVKIIPLRRTGYMNLDIQIPDPQVRVVGEEQDESQRPTPSPPADMANGNGNHLDRGGGNDQG
ncbi:hypothetical protein ABEF95_013134 [Exophiala dermatitidis]